jgi:hypothetical protein
VSPELKILDIILRGVGVSRSLVVSSIQAGSSISDQTKGSIRGSKSRAAKIMAERWKIVAVKKLWKISETGYSSRTTLFSHFLLLSA